MAAHSTTTAPHKPLFFLAGLWALVAPSVWIWPGLVPDPLFWHQHEFFFGMAAAAIGGYLLTALPHWADRGIGATSLCLLVLAWMAGRAAQFWPQPPPIGMTALAMSYPVILGLLLSRGLLRARAWPRLWMAALPLALAGAEMMMAGLRDSLTAPLALTLGFSLMIGLIGGRIVPAFTRSRLRHIAPERSLAPDRPLRDHPIAGRLAALATAAALLLLSAGHEAEAGLALLVAGALHLLRLSRWRMAAIAGETDILMMQTAFALLAFGEIIVGTALIRPDVLAVRNAVHMLTMGAMGGMILAIACRPLLPRARGKLQSTRGIELAFVLICAGALVRVFLPDAEMLGLGGRDWSALFWMGAWALYLLRTLRCWNLPAPFPALSADQGGGSTY